MIFRVFKWANDAIHSVLYNPFPLSTKPQPNLIPVQKPKYFECWVFRPAFGCCAHPKAGGNTFFQPFSSFFVHFLPFSVISSLKSTKNVENLVFP